MTADPTFSSTLETPRLRLRTYADGDAAALLRFMDSNREILRRDFHETVDRLGTLDDAGAFIRDSTAQREGGKVFIYGIWARAAPTLMGQIKVKNIAWNVPAAELSYFIGAEFHRRGHATEAVLAVLREAFGRLQFNRIYARVVPSNRESAQFARKLGMVHEGLHHKEFRDGYGELQDVDYFSITRDEYPAIRMKFQPILGS